MVIKITPVQLRALNLLYWPEEGREKETIFVGKHMIVSLSTAQKLEKKGLVKYTDKDSYGLTKKGIYLMHKYYQKKEKPRRE